MIYLHALLLITILEILNLTGFGHSDRPQYFAPSYIQRIENFLVQKTAGDTGIGHQWETEFQIHCGTIPPTRLENKETVPTSYTYPIRRTNYTKLAAADEIVIHVTNQHSRFKMSHPLLFERGIDTAAYIMPGCDQQRDTTSITICIGNYGTNPKVEQAIG